MLFRCLYFCQRCVLQQRNDGTANALGLVERGKRRVLHRRVDCAAYSRHKRYYPRIPSVTIGWRTGGLGVNPSPSFSDRIRFWNGVGGAGCGVDGVANGLLGCGWLSRCGLGCGWLGCCGLGCGWLGSCIGSWLFGISGLQFFPLIAFDDLVQEPIGRQRTVRLLRPYIVHQCGHIGRVFTERLGVRRQSAQGVHGALGAHRHWLEPEDTGYRFFPCRYSGFGLFHSLRAGQHRRVFPGVYTGARHIFTTALVEQLVQHYVSRRHRSNRLRLSTVYVLAYHVLYRQPCAGVGVVSNVYTVKQGV